MNIQNHVFCTHKIPIMLNCGNVAEIQRNHNIFGAQDLQRREVNAL